MRRLLSSLVSPPEGATQHSPGLARNDSLVLFSMGAFFLTGAFFVDRQKELVGSYMRSQRPRKDPFPVLNMPLRLVENGTDVTSFSQVSEAQKEAREEAVLQMVRQAHELSQSGYLKAGFKVELAGDPEALKKRAQQRLREETAGLGKPAGGSSSDASSPAFTGRAADAIGKRSMPSWALARYTLYSLFDKEQPEARYLPVSFVLGCTDLDSGEQFLFYGGVRRMVVESDASLLEEQDAKNVKLKVALDLVDCNWRNFGRVLGDPFASGEAGGEAELISREIRVECAQESDRKMVTVVLGAAGRRLNLFVSTLAFRMEPEPVRFADDALRPFLVEGLSMQVNARAFVLDDKPPSVRITAAQGRRLLFLLRALPVLFEEIKFRLAENPARKQVGQMYAQEFGCENGPLPLELVVRRGPDLQGLVAKVIVRTSVPMRAAGDLDWDTNALMFLELQLASGQSLELACRTCKWAIISKGGTKSRLGDTASVDLVALSELPRKSYRTRGADLPAEGRFASKPFQSRRFARPVDLGLDAYEKARGLRPSLAVDSLEVRPRGATAETATAETATAGTATAALFGSSSWWKTDVWAKAVLATTAALLLLGLGFFALGSHITGRFGFALGALARVLGLGACAFFLVCAALLLAGNLRREQADVALALSPSVLLVATLAALAALRFNPGTSATFFAAAALAVVATLVVYGMPLAAQDASENRATKTAEPSKELRAVLLVGLLVLATSSFLLGNEAYKMGVRARVSTRAPPVRVLPAPSSASPALFLVALALALLLAHLLAKSRNDSCDRLAFLIERKRQAVKDSRLAEGGALRVEVLEGELRELEGQLERASCSGIFGRAGPRVAIGALLLLFLGMYVLAPFSLRGLRRVFPTRVPGADEGAAAVLVEDARQTPRAALLKMALGSALVLGAAAAFLPRMSVFYNKDTYDQLDTSTCPVARDNLRAFYKTFARDANVYAYDADEKMLEINRGFDSLGCFSPEDIAVVTALAIFLALWLIAYTLPGKRTAIAFAASPLHTVALAVFAGLALAAYAWMRDRARVQAALESNLVARINAFGRGLVPDL